MYYNLVVCANDIQIFYDRDGDELIHKLRIVRLMDPNYNTILTKDEKIPVREELFKELLRIYSLFKQNENVTGFEIFDSFQYSEERKFSIEFLEDNIIKVAKIEEEENEL
jgi:hypothetical protein